jgi:hypothetical protein
MQNCATLTLTLVQITGQASTTRRPRAGSIRPNCTLVTRCLHFFKTTTPRCRASGRGHLKIVSGGATFLTWSRRPRHFTGILETLTA